MHRHGRQRCRESATVWPRGTIHQTSHTDPDARRSVPLCVRLPRRTDGPTGRHLALPLVPRRRGLVLLPRFRVKSDFSHRALHRCRAVPAPRGVCRPTGWIALVANQPRLPAAGIQPPKPDEVNLAAHQATQPATPLTRLGPPRATQVRHRRVQFLLVACFLSPSTAPDTARILPRTLRAADAGELWVNRAAARSTLTSSPYQPTLLRRILPGPRLRPSRLRRGRRVRG